MARLTKDEKVILEEKKTSVILLKENHYPIRKIADFVMMSESWVNKVIAEHKKLYTVK